MAGTFTAAVNIATPFTTQIDFGELLAGTGVPLDIIAFEFGQTSEVGDAQEEMLTLIMKRITGAPTSGSGGGTGTFRSEMPSGTATATLETGNTTKLTGGTSVELKRWSWNIRGEKLYVPVPEQIARVDSATRVVWELATTPADSIAGIQGWVEILELV